jgi:hypothetical protein
MHIICPHCQNPIELIDTLAWEEIVCPSCGSTFRLHQGTTVLWKEPDGRQKLGRFEILETVGHGAFGTVYKARDPELDRVVAIKVPRAGNVPSESERDRFLREGRSAAQLRHSAIVPVHEVGQADGVPFLVSDFVAGMTLADRLTGKRLRPREGPSLVAALADVGTSAAA